MTSHLGYLLTSLWQWWPWQQDTDRQHFQVTWWCHGTGLSHLGYWLMSPLEWWPWQHNADIRCRFHSHTIGPDCANQGSTSHIEESNLSTIQRQHFLWLAYWTSLIPLLKKLANKSHIHCRQWDFPNQSFVTCRHWDKFPSLFLAFWVCCKGNCSAGFCFGSIAVQSWTFLDAAANPLHWTMARKNLTWGIKAAGNG